MQRTGRFRGYVPVVNKLIGIAEIVFHLTVAKVLIGIAEINFQLGLFDEFTPHPVVSFDGGVGVFEEDVGVGTFDADAVDFGDDAEFAKTEPQILFGDVARQSTHPQQARLNFHEGEGIFTQLGFKGKLS